MKALVPVKTLSVKVRTTFLTKVFIAVACVAAANELKEIIWGGSTKHLKKLKGGWYGKLEVIYTPGRTITKIDETYYFLPTVDHVGSKSQELVEDCSPDENLDRFGI
jgi:hypothetical protein